MFSRGRNENIVTLIKGTILVLDRTTEKNHQSGLIRDPCLKCEADSFMFRALGNVGE